MVNRMTPRELAATQQIVPAHKSTSWSSVSALEAPEEASGEKQVAASKTERKRQREWRPAKRLGLLRRQLFCGLISATDNSQTGADEANELDPGASCASRLDGQQRCRSARNHLLSRRKQLEAAKLGASLERTSGNLKEALGEKRRNKSQRDESLADRCCLTLGGRKTSQQSRFSFLPRLEVKRRRSLSPSRPFNQLVRMIVDRNVAKQPNSSPSPDRSAESAHENENPVHNHNHNHNHIDSASESRDKSQSERRRQQLKSSAEFPRDMLIPPGSALCPSDRLAECQEADAGEPSPMRQLVLAPGSVERVGQRWRAASSGDLEEPARSHLTGSASQMAAQSGQQQQLRADNRAARSRAKVPDRMGQLIGLLDQYAKQMELGQRKQSSVMERAGSPSPASKDATQHQQTGADRFPGRMSLRDREEESGMFQLEESWTSFVQLEQQTDADNQTADERAKRQRERANLKIQQDAIWELLTTEAFYIKSLKVILDVFLATLASLQRHSLLLEIDVNRLSSNVGEIYEANLSFWSQCLQPMLTSSRTTNNPLDPSAMRNAFVQIRNTFNPYSRYCLDHTACLSYLKEQNRTNECFKVYLAWCECQKDCERLRLTDLLAKPMQRLTRYSLLLKAILKKTDNREQSAALEEMIAHMNKFVLTVDLELRKKDELERLLLTAHQLDSYDIGADVYNDEIDRLVKNYCHFELMQPLFNCPRNCRRQLLFDSQQSHKQAAKCDLQVGQIRFKDAQVSGKLDVVVLVFTDQLFICKQTAPTRLWHQSAHNQSGQSTASRQVVAGGSPSESCSPMRAGLCRAAIVGESQVTCKPAAMASSLGAGAPLNLSNKLSPQQQFVGRASIGSQSSLVCRQWSDNGGSLRQTQLVTSCLQTQANERNQTAAHSNAININNNNNNARGHIAASLQPNSAKLDSSPAPIKRNIQPGARQHRAASGQFLLAGSGAQEAARTGSVANRSAAQAKSRPAHYASASSLMGAAAREFFSRSSDNSRSGDQVLPQAAQAAQAALEQHYSAALNEPIGSTSGSGGNAGKSAAGRLRVIRSPYPIERLVFHELKDGHSILCCQLNDSQTIATSFVLYLATPASSNVASSAGEPSRLTGQRSRSSNYLRAQQEPSSSSGRAECEQPEQAGQLGPASRRASDSRRQSTSFAQLTPAGQLINLFKQAQARYQCAADFHGRKLTRFASATSQPADTDLRAGELIEAARSSTWSSMRNSRHAPDKPPVENVTNGYVERHVVRKQSSLELNTNKLQRHQQQQRWLLELEVTPQEQHLQERSLCHNRQSNPVAKAVIEQHQSMMLNHGEHEGLSQFEYKCQLSPDRSRLQVTARLIDEPRSGASCGGDEAGIISGANELTSRQWLCGSSAARAGSQSSVFEDQAALIGHLPASLSLSSSRKSSMQTRTSHLSFQTPFNENGAATDQLLSPNRIYSVSGLTSASYRRVSSGGLRIGAPLQSHSVGRVKGHFSRSARVVANQQEMSSDNEAALLSRGNELEALAVETITAPLSLSNAPVSADIRPTASALGSPGSSSSGASASQSTVQPDKSSLYRGAAFKQKEDDSRRASTKLMATIRSTADKHLPIDELANEQPSQAQAHLRKSGRRNLSSLKRQNVIISASSDHQQCPIDAQQPVDCHAGRLNIRESSADTCTMNTTNTTTTTTTSGPSTSLLSSGSAVLLNSGPRRFEALSQATTMDQTSVTLDDSNALDWLAELRPDMLPSSADARTGSSPDYRAMSFELGSLKNRNSLNATDILLNDGINVGGYQHCANDHLGSVRSASMETRSPVSVTLTLPNNEQVYGDDIEEPLSNSSAGDTNQYEAASVFDLTQREPSAVYLDIPKKHLLHGESGFEDNIACLGHSQVRKSCLSPFIDQPTTRRSWTPETSSSELNNGELAGDTGRINRSASGGVVILSKLRRAFKFSLEKASPSEPALNLCSTDRHQSALSNQAHNLPVLKVITASPIALDSNCEFPNETSADLSGSTEECDCSERPSSECQSSPDSPSNRQIKTDKNTIFRRSSSTTELLNSSSSTQKLSSSACRQVASSGENFASITSSDDSIHFLKKCQTLLMFHRRLRRHNKRPSNQKHFDKTKSPETKTTKKGVRHSDLGEPDPLSPAHNWSRSPVAGNSRATEVETQFKKQVLAGLQTRLQLVSLSDTSNLNDEPSQVLYRDSSCDGNPITSPEQNVTFEENNLSENDSSTGYLGFHEKLDLHNRLVRETGYRISRKSRNSLIGRYNDESVLQKSINQPVVNNCSSKSNTTIQSRIANGMEPDFCPDQRRRKSSIDRTRGSSSVSCKFSWKRDTILANVTHQHRSALRHLKKSVTGEAINSLFRATSMRNIAVDQSHDSCRDNNP